MGSEYKAIMDHQLLRRIPETGSTATLATFGGSCSSCAGATHHVNEALRGMWHEVALGETGSLVVQNIFENCLEEDKVRRTFSLQSTKVLTIFYSVLASMKSSLVSMSLLMASSATGAFSTSASMVPLLIAVVPSTTSSALQLSTAWINMPPR
jgi:hypothetical protein